MSVLWSKLESPPFSTNIELLSCNNEIWSIPTGYLSRSDSIYQYSFSTNKWIEIITKTHAFNHATIDKQNRLIYAQNADKELMEINLNTKTIRKMQTIPNMVQSSIIIYANDNIHLFSYGDISSDTKYIIFDKETHKYEERSTCSPRCVGWSFAFIKSKLCIVTTVSDLTANTDPFMAEFSLTDYKWTKHIEIPFNSAIVSTKNDQYIIFMGGYDKTKALWT
eukprot:127911_1